MNIEVYQSNDYENFFYLRKNSQFYFLMNHNGSRITSYPMSYSTVVNSKRLTPLQIELLCKEYRSAIKRGIYELESLAK